MTSGERSIDRSLDPKSLQRDLEASYRSYVRDLALLVNIDSGTHDKPGVDRVARHLADWYAALGGELSISPHVEYGDTVTATWTGEGGHSLLLLGHTDTVYASGSVGERPFTVVGERAFGPGVADMKAGNLAIVYALRALFAHGFRAFGRITVVHNSDEEVGSPSSKAYIAACARQADATLVLEAGRENGDIVAARKGIASFDLEVTGRSAHAGVNHGAGRSAALELAHLVVALEALNGTIPTMTLNVGVLSAGTRRNVVPESATARVEVRAAERQHLEAAMAAVERTVARRVVEGTSVTLQSAVNHWPMHRTAASSRLVAAAQHLAGELGLTVEAVATGGASDGNTAAAAGSPVLDGLGPVGGAAHSPNEYVELSSVVPRTALLGGLIAAVAAGSL